MKKLIALMLSIFIILLVSTSAFAAGFSGGSRAISSFGSFGFTSDTLATKLSYEALNTLAADINYGLQSGEIVFENGMQAVTVTLWDAWDAYIITGRVGGVDYVVVNGSGGRYYSPVPQSEYSVVAIAGVSNYYLTNRPAGTTGNGYLGDLYLTYDNWLSIQSTLNNLTGDKSYYTYGHSINGEFRYYLANRPSTTTYYVCNSAGQLFYTIKDTGSSEDTGGGGSTFDPTEVITAINSVYDAINSQGSRLANGLSQLTITANTISDILNLHMNNVVDGFGDIQNSLSTLNSYFTDLSGLFPVQETITLLGSDTRVAWDSADRITNVTAAGFNGDLIVKERPGDLVDESGYEKVTINETEYSLYNDNNGYRRIKAANEYPNTGPSIPENSLFYFPFDGTLSSTVGDMTLNYSSTPIYSFGVSGDALVFDGTGSLTSDTFDLILSNNQFTYSFWSFITAYPEPISPSEQTYYEFFFGRSGYFIRIYIQYDGTLHYLGYGDNSTYFDGYSSSAVSLNTWHNIAVTCDGSNVYCFVDGVLNYQASFSPYFGSGSSVEFGVLGHRFPSGSMVDDLIFVNGSCLWNSSFDAEREAIFSSVVSDYFLPCTDQEITLNFYDTEGEQVTEHRWNQYTVNTSRLPNGYSEVEYIESTGTQYIDIGVQGKTGLVASGEFLLTSNQSSMLLGCINSQRCYMLSFVSNVPRYGYIDWYNATSALVVNQKYNFEVSFAQNSQYLKLDGFTVISSSNTNSFSNNNNLFLFAYNDNGNAAEFAQCRFYFLKIYDNGTLVRDFVPCKNPSNAVGLYDLVNGQFYGNSGTGSFTAGNEVSNGSGIGQLVGVVSSTNANAYPDGGEQDGFYYEYIGAYTEYPSFSQTLVPTDVNGNAIIMGRLEDDFSEIYMDISTMMWYCHDPQTQTEILLSSANQQIMNDTIYVRQNYTTIPADQITADALQNLLPVDSPVYLDMPDGAKLTITYDHYTGWFRMMYILMDKQTKLLSDLDIVSETIINVENTVIDITNNNPAYNVFYITKTDGTTESVGDAAKDAAVFVGDVLSMFYRLVFDDALDNAGVIQDFEDVLTTTNTGVNVW